SSSPVLAAEPARSPQAAAASIVPLATSPLATSPLATSPLATSPLAFRALPGSRRIGRMTTPACTLNGPRATRRLPVLLSALLLVAPPGAAQAPNDRPIRGFSAASAARQHAVEARLASLLSRDSTGRAFREFTSAPHPAGTIANKKVAEQIADRLRR